MQHDAPRVRTGRGPDTRGKRDPASKFSPTPALISSSLGARALASDDQYLYFMAGYNIERVELATGGQTTFVANVVASTSTDLAVDADAVYWTDRGSRVGTARVTRAYK